MKVLSAINYASNVTLVWDPVVDRLVAMFARGASTAPGAGADAGLIRQYLHGDNGYDDPVQVRIAASAGATPAIYYPIVDEAGTGSLAAIVSDDGNLIERLLYADSYGDAPRYLQGAVVDHITLEAKKTPAGILERVKVRVHLSEKIVSTTLSGGVRLASIKADKTVAQTAGVAPSLEDDHTILWALSGSDWNALTTASDAQSLEVSVTSTLRAQGWGGTLVAPIPAWALRVYADTESTTATPVIKREPLSLLTTFISGIPNGETQTHQPLYEIHSLYLAASEESKTKLLTGFKAAPFVEPATGLVYFRNRFYDPSTGTWLTPDARGYSAGSSNLYAGFNNDPVNNIDPDGLEALPEEFEELRRNGAMGPGTLGRWAMKNPRQASSAGVGFIPVVGEIHDASQVLTGHDVVSGERLAWWERGISAGAFVIPFVGGSAARSAVKGAVGAVATRIADLNSFRWFDDLGEAAARGLNEGASAATRELVPAISRTQANLAKGNVMEAMAKQISGDAGETIVETQFRRGAAMQGFDFLSFTGTGADARLFINEVKQEAGRVGSRRFTSFGFGKSGQRTFDEAFRVAEQRIQAAASMDDVTREVLLRQLRGRTARIRLLGGQNTIFDPLINQAIGARTGFITGQGFVLP